MPELEGIPNRGWSDEQLAYSIRDWSNSVKVVAHDLETNRPTWSPEWLHGVGERIEEAVQILIDRHKWHRGVRIR